MVVRSRVRGGVGPERGEVVIEEIIGVINKFEYILMRFSHENILMSIFSGLNIFSQYILENILEIFHVLFIPNARIFSNSCNLRIYSTLFITPINALGITPTNFKIYYI